MKLLTGINLNQEIADLQTLIEKKDLDGLIARAQILELNLAFENDKEVEALGKNTIFMILFLAYLLDNDLDSARHLCKRVPKSISPPDFKYLVAILSALTKQHLSKVLPIIHQKSTNPSTVITNEEQVSMDTDEDVLSSWSSEIQPALRWFIEDFTNRRVAALAATFERIQTAPAAFFLGLDSEKAYQVLVQKFGWKTSDDGQQLIPPSTINAGVKENDSYKDNPLDHFGKLGTMAIRAEL